MSRGKITIGLSEKIDVIGQKGHKVLNARIDTGASISSIDKKLAERIGVGPVTGYTLIKQAHGKSKRPIVKLPMKIRGKEFKYRCSLADRSHMKYKLLIGRNILKNGFLIDPDRK